MNSFYLLVTLIFMVVCMAEGAALACIGLCRLQQLDLLKSKSRWVMAYLAIFILGTAAAFEPLTNGGWWPVWARVVEVVVLAGLLWAVLRTRSKWKKQGEPAAPPESNRSPLGDK
jgi:hypothetical protein